MDNKIKNYLQLAIVFAVCWGIAGIFDGSGFIEGIGSQIDAIGSIISYIIKAGLFFGIIWLVIEMFKDKGEKKENVSVSKISNDQNNQRDYDDYENNYDENYDEDYYEDYDEYDIEEVTQNLIESTPILNEIGIPYEGIEIFKIQTTDHYDEPFTDSDDNLYVVLTFKAFSDIGFEQAKEAFIDEEYYIPKRKLLTMKMTLDLAENLKVGMVGTLTLHTVFDIDNNPHKLPLEFIPKI